jgi:serine protease Do
MKSSIGLFAGLCWVIGHCLSVHGQIDPRLEDAEKARIAAIAKAKSASVSVFAPGGNGGGSGVVVTPDGFALTNYHVTKPCGSYMQCSMPDGVLYDAVIVGIDPVGDVALIKLLGRNDFPTASIGDSDAVRVGQWCFAVGNPFLLATDFQPTVTWGIVSGVHRYQYPAGTLLEYADCIQTDAAINPGNSGGPLFNADGELIGINGRGSFEKRGRVNVGVGYAISINQIKNFFDHLRSGRIVDHSTLGATVASDEYGRVLVDNILDSSDAAHRGLAFGDEIVRFGGREIKTVNEFKNVLGIFPKGWRVPLTFQREGKQYDIIVRLTGVHSETELVDLVQPEVPGSQSGPPGEQDPENPTPGNPHLQKAESAVPAAAAKMIENRRGYANYYFNRLALSDVFSRMNRHSVFSDDNSAWVFSGKTNEQLPFQFILKNEQSGVRWDLRSHVLDPKVDLDQQLWPERTGGLLPALHLWRKLLVTGPEKYGQVDYYGSLPFGPAGQLADVVIATVDVTQCYFFFDKSTADLIGIEMHTSEDVEPCVVRFEDFRTVGSVNLPHLIIVSQGNLPPIQLAIDQMNIQTIDE